MLHIHTHYLINQVDKLDLLLWDVLFDSDIATANLLIDTGAKDYVMPDGPNRGLSSLWLTLFHREYALSDILISRGAIDCVITAANNSGVSTLVLALYNHYFDIAEKLVERGAKDYIIETGELKGHSALWFALYNQQIVLAKKLLEHGAIDTTPTNGPNKGLSVLFIALCNKQFDIAEILIAKGATDSCLSQGIHKGKSAITFAIEHLRLDIARNLISTSSCENKIIIEALLKYSDPVAQAIIDLELPGVIYNNKIFDKINKYKCPISLQLIMHPISKEDGFTYNLTEIALHIGMLYNSNRKITSPLIPTCSISAEMPNMNRAIAEEIVTLIHEIGPIIAKRLKDVEYFGPKVVEFLEPRSRTRRMSL